ncbi:uncharacterized protein LOC131319980 isoform X3 [Rhododendron vialii]|uniref:uncharacterized protein LOC131319980 isoform X3 n=1 Tax=Rhododendron vialii TaxID=182163 RepID=UPI0026600DBD|nr:uncharacterized protein LOC131319980 isoform X3 [Rhododendron vialii]
MATTTSIAPVSISVFNFWLGGAHLKSHELRSMKCNSFGNPSRLTVRRKSSQRNANQKLIVCSELNESRGGGGNFVAGFVLGGALFGTVAYIFAPRIRKAILNEDEHGFRRPRRLPYYDEGLVYDERLNNPKQTLSQKIGQLNAAIDTAIDRMYSRFKGGNHMPSVPTENKPEEATMCQVNKLSSLSGY